MSFSREFTRAPNAIFPRCVYPHAQIPIFAAPAPSPPALASPMERIRRILGEDAYFAVHAAAGGARS